MRSGIALCGEEIRYCRGSGKAVFLVLATASAAASSAPQAPALLLKLSFTELRTRSPVWCSSTKFALKEIARATPAGNLLWRTHVPHAFSACPKESDVSPWVTEWHEPEARSYDYYNLGISFLRTPNSLAFASSDGMFALAQEDGKLQFEWVTRKSSRDFYWFDDGTFTVRRGNIVLCKGRATAANVFTFCDGRFFFFNQHVGAVIENSGRTVSESAWQERFHDSGSTARSDRARIPLGPYELILEGEVYLR